MPTAFPRARHPPCEEHTCSEYGVVFLLLRLGFGGRSSKCADVLMELSLYPQSWLRLQVPGRASPPGYLHERLSWRGEELQLSSCWVGNAVTFQLLWKAILFQLVLEKTWVVPHHFTVSTYLPSNLTNGPVLPSLAALSQWGMGGCWLNLEAASFPGTLS